MKKSIFWPFLLDGNYRLIPVLNFKKLMHLLVFGLFLFSTANAFATIRYVKAGAAGNGSSWSSPSGDFQAMINASAAGDQVWVATGTYKPNAYPNGCSNCGTDTRNYAFVLKDNVAIYGGFAGNENDISQRSFKTRVTTLSGDIGTTNNNSDNCYHVIVSVNLTNTSVLDGFTITGGNANAGNSSTTVSGAQINQYNGGGLYNQASSPAIVNCIFTNNNALITGGAIQNYSNSSPAFINCLFSNNSGGSGGAISGYLSPFKITNCVFYGNSTNRSPSNGGSAIYSYVCAAVITNCTFVSNSTSQSGAISSFYTSPTVTNCIFWNNTGGSIYENYTTTNVSYSLVQGGYGGTGNLNTDPLFFNAADPDGADNVFGTADDGLKQQSNSPVVNSGSNNAIPSGITTDITGGARVQQSTVDMGAYEFPCPLAVITGQPQNTSVCADGTATFTVGVADPNLTYKWYKDGQSARSSSNSATLTINNVTASDAGNYTVDIIGNCGTVTSNAASLTVKSLPSISAQPANTTVCAGGTATFTVAATEANLYYEWYKEGQYFHGSTNSATLTINNVSLSDAGNYTAKIFGSCGTVTSNAASLTIKSAPSISTQPVNTTICAGGTATFTVAATESNLYYEWYKDGQYFHGSTNSATLTINNVLASDAGNFTAKIIGSCGTVTSNAASLTVNVAPSITSCPGNISVNNDHNTCGATVTYSSVVSGSPSPGVTYVFTGATTGSGGGTGSGSVFNSGTTNVTVTAHNSCSPDATCSFTVTVNDVEPPVFVLSPASEVSISQLGRTSTYSNINLNGTGSNIARVIPGTSVTFSFNRNTTVDPGAGGCRLCQTQHYVGIDGGHLNKCQFDEHNDISGSGNYTFAAPTAPGVYYINQSASWNYGCLDNPGYTSGYGSNTIAVLVVGNTSNTLTANNISVNNDAGVCGAVVSYPSITAFDNCSSVTVIQTAGKTSGSVFPSGTTINTFEATDAAGNKATYSFTVTVIDNEKPVPINATLPDITSGCSITATAPTATDNCSGTITATTTDPVTYNTTGTYTINWIYTDANGNSAQQTQHVIINRLTKPTITAGGPTTFCNGGSVTLTAPGNYAAYHWSNGETTQSINVTSGGFYTVTVSNESGCSSNASDSVHVIVNGRPYTPVITAESSTTFCAGGSVTLSAPIGYTYAWSDGETTQSVNITQSGSYTVTTFTGSGCSSDPSAPVTVTVNTLPAKPVITAGGPTTFYDGGSVTLSAPAYSSYLWSTTETTQSIVAAISGNYTVTVSNAAGCSAASYAVAVTVKDKPVIDTLSPVADAYVRNGDYTTLNYGTDTALGVKTSSTKGFSRNTYLKFSLGNVGSVASAKLRIYGSNIASTAVVNALLYPVVNDSWTESGINWNNAPAASSPTALGFAAVDNQKKYYDINITDFVKSQFADDKVVSLQLRDPHNNNLALSFNSKEYGANPPQLIVENEDQIAPYAEVKLIGSVTSPNNYNNQVKIVVVASDKGGSGLALTEYSLNNAAFVKYDTAIIINTPGSYTVTARATDGNGNIKTTGVTSFNVVVPQAPLTDTLAPVADASVRSDGYAAINYGHDSTFWVKNSNTKSYSRNAYLKFSLMNSISSVSSAKLRIYGYNADTAASVTTSVLPVTNDTWYEGEINWNNAPKASSSNPLGAVAVGKVPQYYDIDVTAFVKGQFAGDKVVTFLLKDLLKTNSAMIFNSRENAQNQPRLIITAGSGSSNSAAITSIARPVTVQPQPAEEKLSLTAYPNPSTVSFKLTVGSSNLKDRIAVAIFDEGGRMMETRLVNAGETLVLGDRYRAGVYFAQAIQAGKRVNVKIIKQAW